MKQLTRQFAMLTDRLQLTEAEKWLYSALLLQVLLLVVLFMLG